MSLIKELLKDMSEMNVESMLEETIKRFSEMDPEYHKKVIQMSLKYSGSQNKLIAKKVAAHLGMGALLESVKDMKPREVYWIIVVTMREDRDSESDESDYEQTDKNWIVRYCKMIVLSSTEKELRYVYSSI